MAAENILQSDAPLPQDIPKGPLDTHPSQLQSLLHRATHFIELGAWLRTRETSEAVISLWRDGSMSAVTPLIRLVFEIWSVSYYLVLAIEKYNKEKDMEKLSKVVNKVFEGVKTEVFLPYGAPASETPIHVLDSIRALNKVNSNALAVYEYLCESSHPNYPRYMEWWLLGKAGDNWSNDVVYNRGHQLLENTVAAFEQSVSGIKETTTKGFNLCGRLYKQAA